jgi:hypothetical protein
LITFAVIVTLLSTACNDWLKTTFPFELWLDRQFSKYCARPYVKGITLASQCKSEQKTKGTQDTTRAVLGCGLSSDRDRFFWILDVMRWNAAQGDGTSISAYQYTLFGE